MSDSEVSVGKLYIMHLSPPCRAVLLTAEALGIRLDIIEINLFQAEHLTPEYLEINPNHSVPTFVDNDGTAIGDSHAIMAYLVSKFGRTDVLYPKDFRIQAAIDSRLHFNSGFVTSLHSAIVAPMYRKLATGPSLLQTEFAERRYATLNRFLEGNLWVAGTESPTIADFALISSISGLSIVAPFDKLQFRNIDGWMKRCEALPYFHVTKKGYEIYTSMLNDMMNDNHDFLEDLTKSKNLIK